jgi:hypothetical protein
VGAVTLASRAIQIVNADNPSVVYVNRDQVSILSEATQVDNVYFIAVAPGTAGNAPKRSVAQVAVGPGLIGCINLEPFSGGLDRETDTFFRNRAMAMIMSLARSQASAIEALALNFTDSTGAGILHANAIEYVDQRRGYTELVVSNGAGMPGATRSAAASQGTLPTLQGGTRHTFWFDYPAATTPVITIAGTTYRANPSWWVPIDEKGAGWTQGALPATVVPGAAWKIENHKVYQGWIKEFQEVVNKTCAAAGTRVRVVAAELQNVRLSANCVARSGSSILGVMGAVKAMIVEFFNRTPPGSPVYIHQLHDWVAQVEGLQNIIFYDVQGGLQEDLYPGSPRRKLTTDVTRITLT